MTYVCCMCGKEIGKPHYRTVVFKYEGIFGGVIKTRDYCEGCFTQLTNDERTDDET